MAETGLEIHQTRRFSKALQAMQRADKSARDAAARAAKIIADLQRDPLHDEAECKRTRYGELRLQQCRKYDLACGYRLIGLKRQGRLIFVYIGSHDDCQRWIENNRENVEEIESEPVPRGENNAVQLFSGAPAAESERDEYEEQLMARLDEHVLRDIFSGLC
ncbi:MAG: hypothetical protein KKD73_04765 [Proteobacteria bacterium]|nr:hypothetical protein [Pseudomonadota bacterium]MBU1639402.1 hypothetical protein [Pseudomonadota bacterium]